MRLIDADILYDELKEVSKLKRTTDKGKERALYVAEFINFLGDASTIEAIPIEWLEREFSRRGIVTSHFRVMVGNEQLPDEVYVDARIVVRDIIDVWREEQKDEID